VALAMDLAGHGPDGKRLPDGGPDQDDEGKFRDFNDAQARRMWTYHAVAAVLHGHALLAARDDVIASRIGVTGISWGGYLTCIIAGIDDALKVAVPVYGCGFLEDNSAWLPRFKTMIPEQRKRWVSFFDPSRYLAGVRCPILFVNGTNDFAYPLDSYQRSYRLVPVRQRTLCVTVRMPHGHYEGWAPQEIGLFVDSCVKGGKPLAELGALTIAKGQISVPVRSATVPLVSAKLHYTTDTGAWQNRNWKTVDAKVCQSQIQAKLPADRPLVAFLTATDERGAVVSSEHAELGRDSR
jgi:dienelactone hydrolase